MIHAEQANLNTLYDSFVAKYGRINSRTNVSAFSADNAYYLLSLWRYGTAGNFCEKQICSLSAPFGRSDHHLCRHCLGGTSLSLAEKAKVDMPYMMELTRKSEDAILS